MTPAARKMLAWELLEHGAGPAMLGRLHRLGDVCTVMPGGSRVCGADATAISGSLAQTNPRAISRANMLATNYPIPGGIPGIRVVATPQTPSVLSVLAQAQAVYNQNPAGLTQNQWSLLQSAGIIPNTLPYSSAAQLPSSQSAAATAAVAPASTDIMLGTFDLTQFVESVPWWGWALGAGGVFFLLSNSKKGGRR